MSLLLHKKLRNFNFERHVPELFEKIRKIKIIGKIDSLSSEKTFVGIVDAFVRKDKLLYIRAYKQYLRKGGLYVGNPQKLAKTEHPNGEFHAILITSEGDVLHEISQYFHETDIKQILLDLFKSCGFHQISIQDIEKFDLKTMRAFYKSAKRIMGLSIKEIGEKEPNPQMPPEDIEKMTQDIAEGSNFIDFKSGVDKDLKQSQLINKGLAKRSDIKHVRGKDEDGDIFEVILPPL